MTRKGAKINLSLSLFHDFEIEETTLEEFEGRRGEGFSRFRSVPRGQRGRAEGGTRKRREAGGGWPW